MIALQAADAGPESIGASAALLADVFPHAPRLDAAWLAWSHLENPLGPSVLAGAREDTRLVAQVAGRLLCARLAADAAPARGILVHHAATSAAFRRRGLLVRLVEAALAHAHGSGAAFAVAVVNQNSVDAFVRKLGFAALGTLDVRVALGPPPARDARAIALDFEPVHDAAWLAWRLAPPGSPYRTRLRGDAIEVWGDSGILGIPVLLGEEPAARRGLAWPAPITRPLAHAWAGLDPLRRHRALLSLPVPLALRPSPLHLVFRPLAVGVRTPRAGAIRFEALDFDAW
ncbi:MAG: GNAT family N-acetyltransferase [Myxococcota bacterium]|jgi:GNAT superfamily N-acetyltransferase|nr:GNAT family N-acetyltransferase [Myxococcota bacterium]